MLRFLAYSVLFFPVVTSLEIKVPVVSGIHVPVDGKKYDFNFIYNFTKYLHGIHRFNSFVTFAQPHTRFRPSSLAVRSLEQALVEDFNVPVIVWGTERTAKLRNNIGLNNLVFVQINNITDPILDIVDYALEGLHFISMLFFHKAKNYKPPSADEIHRFFAWCWSKNMVNVALTFQVLTRHYEGNFNVYNIKNHVYTYSPFPHLTVLNLTEKVRKGSGSYSVDRVKNVKGYTFKALLPYHPPWTFLAPTKGKCKASGNCPKVITGTAGRLFTEYIKFIGGSMKIVEYNNLSTTQMTQKTILPAARNEIDIGVHPFSDLLLSPDIIEGSYPIGLSNACIIVPMRREMPREHYLLRSFQGIIWILIALTFVALLILQFFFGYGAMPLSRNPITLCGYALLSTVSVMCNQISTLGFFQGSFPCYKLVHFVILIMVFVLSNTYIASLTSLLTIAPFDKQIDTADEFLASGLEILARKGQRELYFGKNYLPAKLKDRVRIVDDETLSQHVESLNTSYAYFITSGQLQILQYRQQHLSKPRFSSPSKELCTKQLFVKLPLQWDSPFYNSLTLFFMMTQESGLSSKWEEMTIYEARHLNSFELLSDDVQPWKPLRLEHFMFAGKIFLVIWISAIAVFVGEVTWNVYTKNRNSKNQKKKKVKVDRSKCIVRKRVGKSLKQAIAKYFRK